MKWLHTFILETSFRRRWLLIAGLVIAGPLAAAWDQALPGPESAAAAFRPGYIGTPDADGYWAVGVVDQRGVVVRYDNSGALRWLRHVDDQKMVEPTGSGDAISAGDPHYPDQCTLRRWRADGALVWSSRADDAHQCQAMGPDGSGGAWMRLQTDDARVALRRVAADGMVRARVDLPGTIVAAGARIAADPLRGGIYVAGSRSRPDPQDTRTDAVIVALDAAGTPRWEWLLPSAAGGGGSTFRDAVIGLDGLVYAAGPQGTLPGAKLIVTGLTHDGAQRFQRSIDAPGMTAVEAVLAADDGVYVVLGIDGSAAIPASMRVLQVGGGGVVLLSQELPVLRPMREISDTTAWRSRDGKRLAIAGYAPGDGSLQTQLVQLSAAGEHRASLVQGLPVSSLQLLDSGAVIMALGSASYYPEIMTTLLQFDAAGLPQSAPQTLVGWRQRELYASAAEPDGAMYLVTREGNEFDSAIERIAADGSRDWRVTRSPGVVTPGMPLMAAAGRVCYAARRLFPSAFVVECLDASNGAQIFEHEISDVIDSTSLTRLRVLPSGAVLVWYWQTQVAGDDWGMHFAHIRADGSLLFNRHLGDYPSALDIGATGMGAILTSGVPTPSTRRVQVFGADGSVLFDRPDDFPSYAGNRRIQVAGDGSVLMLGTLAAQNGDSDNLANYYSPDGTLRWSVDLEGATPSILDARIVGDALIYLTGAKDTGQRLPTYVVKSLLGKRSMVDGSLIWHREVSHPGMNSPALAIDPVSGDVVLTSVWPVQRIRVQSFDAVTGAARLDRSESCAAQACEVFATAFGSDGRFRILANAETAARGAHAPIFMLNTPLRASAPLRVDQPGVVGAWFPDYASGQGFLVDYLPASRTVFAPWFAYAPEGGNSLSGQRWFTLQGSASEGATDVELGIYRNSGGIFTSTPITSAQRVGSARLTMQSCSRAALEYVFDVADMAGVAGRYALTRATPGIGDCAVPQPTNGAQEKSQGSLFDARLSGAWHVPAQSGQGLMFSVTPASLLFAAWFTYDPAGAADDAGAQHWFTLQGSLAGVTGDTVVVPIYRTIGGSFDRDPTANTHRVGEATLTAQSCDRATLAYRFDAGEVAAGFAGLNGTLALEKIGGCSP